MLDRRRGQVTAFIIIGILIVVIAGVVLFINRDKVSTTGFRGVQADPVKDFIQECIEDSLVNDMKNIRDNAGYINPSPFIVSIGTPTNPKDLPALMVGGVNKAPLLGNIEDNIATRIKNELVNNCDLSVFRTTYDIKENKDDIRVFVSIQDHEVFTSVNYPVLVVKGEDRLVMDNFFVSVFDDFGLIYDVVRLIVYENRVSGDGFEIGDDLDVFDTRFSEIVLDYDESGLGGYVAYVGTQREADEGIRRVEFAIET